MITSGVRVLWIGRDFEYVEGGAAAQLLVSLRDTGAAVTVLCRRSGDLGRPDLPDGIDWQVVDSKLRRPLGALLSRTPVVAHRRNSTSMRLALSDALDRQWDVVLIDQLGAAWALPQLRVHLARQPGRLVFLVGGERTLGGRNDARKVRQLEAALVDAADLVVAEGSDDGEALLAVLQEPG